MAQEVLSQMAKHKLETRCPPLQSYIQPGIKVLDVGCGPGAISIDVAERIKPGTVVGIDIVKEGPDGIEWAKGLAERSKVSNVSFQVMDAHSLEFDDDTFDLLYSVNVTHYLKDIKKALREWKRVTKPGGWVVASFWDIDGYFTYPSNATLKKYWEARRSQTGDGELYQGRKAFELLSRAGFKDIEIHPYVPPAFCVHPGTYNFEPMYSSGMRGLSKENNEDLLKKGLLSEDFFESAQREWEAWHNHPYAFGAQLLFLAAGKSP